MLINTIDTELYNDMPFGVCDSCGYEFDSNELNEYRYYFCPKCGSNLGVKREDAPGEERQRFANLAKISAWRRELDPCPFCGEILIEFSECVDLVKSPLTDRIGYKIRCSSCGACSSEQRTEGEAVRAWNKRVD